MPEERILKVSNLTKKYGSLLAVNQLSFEMKKGKIYGLLGPNGSGKSTTLGMLLNVINPTSGNFQWYEGKISPTKVLKSIGAIIERPNFYPYLSALKNLKLVCKIKECATDNIEKKLAIVGLLEKKNNLFTTFSLGMKQRLAIASALVNDPDLLILDEPTNGLDPEGINDIRNLIKKIASQGKTILLASHMLDEVEKVCDSVIILKKGRKYYEGAIKEMNGEQNVFELVAKQPDMMQQFFKQKLNVNHLEVFKNKIKVSFKEKMTPEKLTEMLIKNKIYFTYFSVYSPNLEEVFLEITKNEKT